MIYRENHDLSIFYEIWMKMKKKIASDFQFPIRFKILTSLTSTSSYAHMRVKKRKQKIQTFLIHVREMEKCFQIL